MTIVCVVEHEVNRVTVPCGTCGVAQDEYDQRRAVHRVQWACGTWGYYDLDQMRALTRPAQPSAQGEDR